MDKKPYVKLHVQNYLRDTRILPLHVRGACIELFLYISEDGPDRMISATMNEFSRLLRCSYTEVNESLKLLKDKNIYDIEFPDNDDSSFAIKVAITLQNKSHGW